MERAVKTIHTDLAKRFASCVHRDMDQDTARTFRLSVNKDIKKYGKSEQLPTFDEFFKALCFRIDEYNATPHTALPKFTDASGKRRALFARRILEREARRKPGIQAVAAEPDAA